MLAVYLTSILPLESTLHLSGYAANWEHIDHVDFPRNRLAVKPTVDTFQRVLSRLSEIEQLIFPGHLNCDNSSHVQRLYYYLNSVASVSIN